ncbi:MAG: hypothetical protein WD556_12925 [Actinomycetota bacterium]
METRPLPIYLNDHLAGSIAASELANRCESENRDRPEISEVLSRFRRELETERAVLEKMIEAVGGQRSTVKMAMAWSMEKVSRLKLNGGVISYTPLSRLIELEGLIAGVRLKEALWESLIVAGPGGIDTAACGRLADQARRQSGELEALRKTCVLEALEEPAS